jgi:hypothetical protein
MCLRMNLLWGKVNTDTAVRRILFNLYKKSLKFIKKIKKSILYIQSCRFFLFVIFLYVLPTSESTDTKKKKIIRIDSRYMLDLRSFYLTIIPCRKEFWTNFNKYNFTLLCTIRYHFCYGMIQSTKILHTNSISLR